jgi:hypothetical protein
MLYIQELVWWLEAAVLLILLILLNTRLDCWLVLGSSSSSSKEQ